MNTLWIITLLILFIIVGIKDIDKLNLITLTIGEEVFNVAIPLLCTTIFFSGILEICEKDGVIDFLTKLFQPLLSKLFPDLNKNSKAIGYIVTNIFTNMLGLGSAATVSGLIAMKELDKENNHNIKASRSMNTFVILNTAGITLFSTTVMGLRVKYGSLHPTNHIPIAFISSFTTCCFIMLLDHIVHYHE